MSGPDGVSAGLLHHPLTARLNGYATHAFSWTPSGPGTHTATVFLWKGADDPVACSPPSSVAVQVLGPKAADSRPGDRPDAGPPAGGGDGRSGGGPAQDGREGERAGSLHRRQRP